MCVRNTSATRITPLLLGITTVNVAMVVEVVIDTTAIAIKGVTVTKAVAAVTVVADMADMITVTSTPTLLLPLGLPIARLDKMLLGLVLLQTTTTHNMRSMHSTTELTLMPPTVDTKTMLPTTNTIKQLPLNSSNSRLRRVLLLHLLRPARHHLHLLLALDPRLHPLVVEVFTAR